MKFSIRVLIFVLGLFLCSPAYGAVNCTNTMFLNFVEGGGCNEGSPPEYPFTLDETCTATVAQNYCLATVYNVCCELDVIVKYRDDVSSSEVITGVIPGNEADVAQSRFNQWSGGIALNSPAANFGLTGQFEGFIYGSKTSGSGSTADIDITMWKRGFYTKNGSGSGTTVPIESISGGGSGGGLVPTDISGSYTGPYSKGTTFDTPRGYKQGLTKIDASGNPVTQSPYSSGVSSYSSTSTNPDVIAFGNKTFSQVFTDFKTNMQSTSFFTFSNSLFTVPAGGSSVISFDAGRYGVQSFDFADKYVSLFPYIRALILLGFSAISVKIILLKGGV